MPSCSPGGTNSSPSQNIQEEAPPTLPPADPAQVREMLEELEGAYDILDSSDLIFALVEKLRGETEEGRFIVAALTDWLGTENPRSLNARTVLSLTLTYYPRGDVEWIVKVLRDEKICFDDTGHETRSRQASDIAAEAAFACSENDPAESDFEAWEADLAGSNPDRMTAASDAITTYVERLIEHGRIEAALKVIDRYARPLVQVLAKGEKHGFLSASTAAIGTLQTFEKVDREFFCGCMIDMALSFYEGGEKSPEFHTIVHILSGDDLKEIIAYLLFEDSEENPAKDDAIIAAITSSDRATAAGLIVRRAMGLLPMYSHKVLEDLLPWLGAPVVDELLPRIANPAAAPRALCLFRLLVDPVVDPDDDERHPEKLKNRIYADDALECLTIAARSDDADIAASAQEILSLMGKQAAEGGATRGNL